MIHAVGKEMACYDLIKPKYTGMHIVPRVGATKLACGAKVTTAAGIYQDHE